MEVARLINDGLLRPSKYPVMTTYLTTGPASQYYWGSSAVFVGQVDEDGKPHGIVRIILGEGDIYEGGCTPHGLNGFGRRFYGDMV